MKIKIRFLILSFCLSCSFVSAQVKIGFPIGSPDPRAVLELSDTTRGFLLPRMTLTQMNTISTPPDGLLVYNTSYNNIYQYKSGAGVWKPILADSSEWFYDTSSLKLYLRRALNNQDSFYYNISTKKFMYADTRFYRFSGTGIFNLDEGNSDRFIFKTTASRFPRPADNLNSANIYSVYEVDYDSIAYNNPFTANYYGIATDATIIPQATQKVGALAGIRSIPSFQGSDSIILIYGLQNQVSLKGKGYAEAIYGINNVVSVRDSTTTLGIVIGIQNNISYSSPLGTPRISGNLYGYNSIMSTSLNGKVDGNAYGIFLGSINATGIGSTRNWGIFTNKGPSRLGDSVLVTDLTFNLRPRAVFDVNATSAMIIPLGTTAQRPSTLYVGMLRYNTDNSMPEAYTSGGWINLKNPILSFTGSIAPPVIAANSTATVNITVTGAATGNTVTISPLTPLPAGIIIAWANVSASNTVTIAFGNITSSTFFPSAQTFNVKLVQ